MDDHTVGEKEDQGVTWSRRCVRCDIERGFMMELLQSVNVQCTLDRVLRVARGVSRLKRVSPVRNQVKCVCVCKV